MAGMGKRMRPHTLTVPKPLIPIAGKTIVHRLVEEIAKVSTENIEEIAFVIGDFGKDVEKQLCKIAENAGAKPQIYYQNQPLGTAHAVHCATKSLSGPVVIAFADTLFKANFTLNTEVDSVIWVQKVDHPSEFGVVKLDGEGKITDFVEKPSEFVSDLAIIGIYYFKNGENLKNEIQYLLDHNLAVNGEYQLTTALENMKNKGKLFKTGKVLEWMDCGNKDATLHTNQNILEHHQKAELVSHSATIKNSIVIPPCYIGEGVKIENSIVGPHVSVEAKTKLTHVIARNAIIQSNSNLEHVNLKNSMIGNHVNLKEEASELNMGDFSSCSK